MGEQFKIFCDYKQERDLIIRRELENKINWSCKRDWLAINSIYDIIINIDYYLNNSCALNKRILLPLVNYLSFPDYYKNVFNNEECEESNNYKKLAFLLNKGIDLL